MDKNKKLMCLDEKQPPDTLYFAIRESNNDTAVGGVGSSGVQVKLLNTYSIRLYFLEYVSDIFFSELKNYFLK